MSLPSLGSDPGSSRNALVKSHPASLCPTTLGGKRSGCCSGGGHNPGPLCGGALSCVLAAKSPPQGSLRPRRPTCVPRRTQGARKGSFKERSTAQGAREEPQLWLCRALSDAQGARQAPREREAAGGRPARRTTQRVGPSSVLRPPSSRSGQRVTENPAWLPSAAAPWLGPPPRRDWMQASGVGAGAGVSRSPGRQLRRGLACSADPAGPRPKELGRTWRAGGQRGGGAPRCLTARSIPTTASITTPTTTRAAAPTGRSGSRGPHTGDRGVGGGDLPPQG